VWTPRLVSAATDQSSPVGGDVQRILRLGDKLAIDVAFLGVPWEPYGRQWIAALWNAYKATALWALPLPLGGVGSPGVPLVNGAAQTGASLTCDGFTAGYVVKAMQPFSLVHNSRRYLHYASQDCTANGSGQMTLTFSPMLRVSPADNAVLEVAAPKIEGLVPKDLSWPLNDSDVVNFSGFSFTIAESK
jgi:hypothetical protein